MRVLYSLLFYLALPAVLLYFAWRGRRDARWRRDRAQRFGLVEDLAPGNIVVHAASVGEVNAAAPLVRALLARSRGVAVTCFTPTGAARARDLFGAAVPVAFAPLDLPGATRRFMRRTRPRLLIVMETEIWPNLYHAAARAQVPILLANARLSERSVRSYQRFGALFGAALRQVRVALAQSEQDRDRLVACGMLEDRVLVAGNLKFDQAIPGGLEASAAAMRARWGSDRPVLVAASTHAEDETPVLDAFQQIRQALPGALLVLVPRHPERFDAADAAARSRGFETVRHSQGAGVTDATDCVVVDAMGQLLRFYACSDVAFIGGSFGATGGHNPLEAAALGLPVITGPNMHSFAEVSDQLAQAGALIRVTDARELAQTATGLLREPARRKQMGEAGKQVVAGGRGALERTLAAIGELLD